MVDIFGSSMELFLAIANRMKNKAKLILEMHEIVDPLEESILPC